MGIRGDLRLLQQAIDNRWDTEDLKPRVIQAVKDAFSSGDARAQIRAAEIVLKMEAQNQKDEQSQANELLTNILTVAARLGIENVIAGDSQATEGRAIGVDADAD